MPAQQVHNGLPNCPKGVRDARSKAVPFPIDYEMLFDRSVAESYYGVEPEPVGQYYDDARGLVVKTAVNGGPFIQDLIQFAPDAFAFTSAGSPLPAPKVGHHLQMVGDTDWIHFCLRLGSSGFESIGNYTRVDHPSRVCMVSRYPAHTEVERSSSLDESWRVACLWLRPQAVLRFLETSQSRIPSRLSWLTDDLCTVPRHFNVPLNARMYAAVNDILACQFKGGIRRTFIRSKYLEIIAMVYQAALEQGREGGDCVVRLSPKDEQKIATVAEVVLSHLDRIDSLDSLARRTGISRSKMTQGFRALYGISIESYWQEHRMQKAYDLLAKDGLPVKEVAFELGYAELSSFTRAFARAFGISPNNCKN